VIAVVLAVLFLGYASTATDGRTKAGLGIGISLVIIAIGYILSIASKGQIERKRLEMQGRAKKIMLPAGRCIQSRFLPEQKSKLFFFIFLNIRIVLSNFCE